MNFAFHHWRILFWNIIPVDRDRFIFQLECGLLCLFLLDNTKLFLQKVIINFLLGNMDHLNFHIIFLALLTLIVIIFFWFLFFISFFVLIAWVTVRYFHFFESFFIFQINLDALLFIFRDKLIANCIVHLFCFINFLLLRRRNFWSVLFLEVFLLNDWNLQSKVLLFLFDFFALHLHAFGPRVLFRLGVIRYFIGDYFLDILFSLFAEFDPFNLFVLRSTLPILPISVTNHFVVLRFGPCVRDITPRVTFIYFILRLSNRIRCTVCMNLSVYRQFICPLLCFYLIKHVLGIANKYEAVGRRL